MSNKIVVLYTPDGEAVQYRPLSERIKDFLAVYGPEQGYAVETVFQDSLSLKTGLLKLYESALQAGRKPEEVGLPPLVEAGQVLVCRATLKNREGRIVATTHAAKVILSYKDLEILETAARQRLLAALGFGGEVLDADENQDQHDQGFVERPVPTATTSIPDAKATAEVIPWVIPPQAETEIPKVIPLVDIPDATASTPDAVPMAPIPDAEIVSASRVDAKPVAAAIPDAKATVEGIAITPARAKSSASPSSERGAMALAALVRQVEHQVRIRGLDLQELPPMRTVEEARAVLQRLMQPIAVSAAR